jgi:two-component system, LytTR family, response regulator
MTDELKVLIVDDESLARRIIHRQLKAEPLVKMLIEAQNGDEALEIIKRIAPDIIYLDIQMPGCNGFELLEKLRQSEQTKMPVIIFVTAYDEYALKAFDFHALDYLLKPFDRDRFRRSFELAVKQISAADQNAYQNKLSQLIENLKSPNEYLEWVSVKKDDAISLVKIDEIRWIEAQGNYVLLNFSDTKHLLREKMDALEAKLDAAKFIRIHRSAIVNINFISEIEVWGRGEHKIVMNGGKTFGISRHYRSNFDNFLNKKVL